MIKITLKYRNGELCSLKVNGHAGYAEKGQDIVCAAVSAIVPGAFNALKGGDYRFEVKEGHVLFESEKPLDGHDLAVMETAIAQLEGISDSYPEYVSLERITNND